MKAITFTEDEIIENANRFSPVDARMLPKTGKGAEHRTGICRCGKKSGPYESCKKCREHRTLHKHIMKLQDAGMIEVVVDGRGKKGGRVWRKTEDFENAIKAEKQAKIFRRESPRLNRNAPCCCGSGKKNKRCCGKD